ncbi:MAG: hypothetical protein JSW70_03480 [Syntrophobacterales bacterium]|nr:MAG: hypothetical protein JSW70_03480 [Syntrophobacterales bacterium]
MMKRSLLILLVGFIVVVFLGKPLIYSAAVEEHHGHHEAHHGGVLNVIGQEAGHIEIRIEGNVLEAWFVGGGHDTDRSIPIKAEEIVLKATVPGKGEMALVLKAAPMKLAGERPGHCSHFIAKADWLRDVREFEARGEVVFKGIRHELIIKYPEGHDPLHGH